MLNKDNIRELAYVTRVVKIDPIPNYDRVELATLNGWHCIIPKGQFKPGDLGVYFEIDSKVPETNPAFAFMEKRKYHVKTQKMCGVISEGLFMSFDDLGMDVSKYNEGDFLTKELGVTYYEVEDQKRKASSDPNAKYKAMACRHPKLFKNQFIKKIYKANWGKKLLFVFFGKKKDRKAEWPAFVTKTDEERVQNLGPLYTQYRTEPWIATEKIDGSSSTFAMKRIGKKKFQFWVCSRNVVQDTPSHTNYYSESCGNVYWNMAKKYNIEDMLKDYLQNNSDVEWAYIQAEVFGESIQKRNYGMKGQELRVFNFVTSKDGRWNSLEGAELLDKYDIPWVPIVDFAFSLPESTDELLDYATNNSQIDGGDREGIVFRSIDGKRSFKAVSPSFLIKYHG